MRYFYVSDEKTSYFYKSNLGICRRTGIGNTEVLAGFGLDGFGLYRDDFTHIIFTDRENDILYLKGENAPMTILVGKDRLKPYDFSLCKINGVMNLFYKVDFEEDVLLFRCILNSDEKPTVVSKLSTEYPDYCINDAKVFFVSECDALGYIDVSSGKAFVKLGFCGRMIDVSKINGKTYVASINDDGVYINSSVLEKDKFAEYPLVFSMYGRIYVQWRSGNFVKYVVSDNGTEWSLPKRYIGSGKEPMIITMISDNDVVKMYGFDGTPVLSPKLQGADSVQRELIAIKEQIAILKAEIKKLGL